MQGDAEQGMEGDSEAYINGRQYRADWMANWATQLEICVHIFESPPPGLAYVLMTDL